MDDEALIGKLLLSGESAKCDFKRDQYEKSARGVEKRSELLKDVLAMANAWGDGPGYIVLGISDDGQVFGLKTEDSVDDSRVQQFIQGKLNSVLQFSYRELTYKGVRLGLITVPAQQRPFYSKVNFGIVKAHDVIVRRGTSTAVALPDEIANMGRADGSGSPKLPKLRFTFSIPGHGPANRIAKTYALYSEQPKLPDFEGDEYVRQIRAAHIAHSMVNMDMLRDGAAYLREQHGMTPLVLHLHNDGALATDVRVALRLDSSDGSGIKAQHEHLTRPPHFGSPDRRPKRAPDGVLTIQRTRQAATATLRWSKLQSGESVSAPAFYLLYLGAHLKELQFQVFADELQEPMHVQLPLQLEVIETETTVATVWNWLRLEGDPPIDLEAGRADHRDKR